MNPNENREVVLYDHFAGDNFSLKFIIKFRKKICVFKLHFMQLFSADAAIFFFKSNFFLPKKNKQVPLKLIAIAGFQSSKFLLCATKTVL